MSWLDEYGIGHDGEPPQEDHHRLGGRWYPLRRKERAQSSQTMRAVVSSLRTPVTA